MTAMLPSSLRSAFRVIAGVTICIAAAAADVAAQDTTSLGPLGIRLRLSNRALTTTHYGSLARLGPDTIFLIDDETRSMAATPLSSVGRFEISRGRHGRAGRGALIGFIAGTTLGAGLTLLGCGADKCESSGGDWAGFFALTMGVAGGLAGTGVGAIIGSFIKTERWEEIPLARLRTTSRAP